MQDFYFESVSLWTENICVTVNRVCACLQCACMIFAERDEMIYCARVQALTVCPKVCYLGKTEFRYHEISRKWSHYLEKMEEINSLSWENRVMLSRDLEKIILLSWDNGGNELIITGKWRK